MNRTDTAWDAVVVGGGPAGAVAALRLAEGGRVLVLERGTEDASRIGESLPPACRPLLRDLGLLEGMDGHRPYLGNRSLWGGGRPATHDFLRDPHGAGWHLDRSAFDAFLRRAATDRGATIRRGETVRTLTRRAPLGARDHWGIVTSLGRRLRAGIVVDATGRGAALARRLGARRHLLDRLTGVYVELQCEGGERENDGFSRIEADEDGWWYTAPLPGGRRIVAHHTDSDRPVLRRLGTADGFLAALRGTRLIAGDLDLHRAVTVRGPIVVPAHSAVTDLPAGEGWLAVGDAALALDPLSSQGLMNALFTGMAGGDAALAMLRGDHAAGAVYAGRLATIRAAYEANLAHFYAVEAARRDGAFWTRRDPAQRRSAKNDRSREAAALSSTPPTTSGR